MAEPIEIVEISETPEVEALTANEQEDSGIVDSDSELYIVEKILGKYKEENGQVKYSVKWQGYDEATWEPAENVAHLPQVEEFEATLSPTSTGSCDSQCLANKKSKPKASENATRDRSKSSENSQRKKINTSEVTKSTTRNCTKSSSESTENKKQPARKRGRPKKQQQPELSSARTSSSLVAYSSTSCDESFRSPAEKDRIRATDKGNHRSSNRGTDKGEGEKSASSSAEQDDTAEQVDDLKGAIVNETAMASILNLEPIRKGKTYKAEQGDKIHLVCWVEYQDGDYDGTTSTANAEMASVLSGLVQYEDGAFEWVPASIIRQYTPNLLLDYYESRVVTLTRAENLEAASLAMEIS